MFSNVLNPSFLREITFQGHAAHSDRVKCLTASLETMTSTQSWQVMAFHPERHGLEREGETRPLILYAGLRRNGSGESYSCFSDVRGWPFSLSPSDKWSVVTAGWCGVFGNWSQQVYGADTHGQQFQGGRRTEVESTIKDC